MGAEAKGVYIEGTEGEEAQKKDNKAEPEIDSMSVLRKIRKKLGQTTDYGVMIATPLPRDCSINIHTSNFCSQATKKPNIGWLYESGYTTEDNRNILVANILDFHPEATHVFFIDGDVVPPKGTIEKLLRRRKDIVSGIYPLFVGGKKCWSVSLKEKPDVSHSLPATGLPQTLIEYGKKLKWPFKATAVGAGCLLVKREVFEAMEWPWFRTERERIGIKTGHDFYFCNKARELGYEIWVDPIECYHQNTQDLLEIFRSK